MPTDAELRLQGAYLVAEWMRVRTKEGFGGCDADGLECDLKHSALIRWLCEGNAALDERPPVRTSRPDHRAAVEGRFEPFEVWLFNGEDLIVDQESWRVIETKGPDHWVAAHRVRWDRSAWSSPWSVRRTDQGWVAERLSVSRT